MLIFCFRNLWSYYFWLYWVEIFVELSFGRYHKLRGNRCRARDMALLSPSQHVKGHPRRRSILVTRRRGGGKNPMAFKARGRETTWTCKRSRGAWGRRGKAQGDGSLRAVGSLHWQDGARNFLLQQSFERIPARGAWRLRQRQGIYYEERHIWYALLSLNLELNTWFIKP